MSDYTGAGDFEGCRIALQKKSKFYWLGTTIMYGGIIFALLGQVIAVKAGISKVTIMFPIMGIIVALIGMTYSGWPVIKACLIGGLGSAFSGSLKADYEVITVDEYGNRTSDGGTESIQLKALANLGQVFIIWAIAPLLVSINIIILTIKGFALKAKSKVKSTVKPTIGFITIRNIIVATAPVIVIAILMGAGLAKVNANEKQVGNFAEQLTAGQTIVVIKNERQIYDVTRPAGERWTGEYATPVTDIPKHEKYSGVTVVTMVKEGDILTVTGQAEKVISNKTTRWFIPIEHEGINGYIEAKFVGIKK